MSICEIILIAVPRNVTRVSAKGRLPTWEHEEVSGKTGIFSDLESYRQTKVSVH